MTPDLFKQAKNLFILQPQGCGANHIANLLSLHEAFEPRLGYTPSEYQTKMVEHYKKLCQDAKTSNTATAHFSRIHNLNPDGWNKHKDKIINSRKKYVFCTHSVHEYYIRRTMIKDLDRRFYIIMTDPEHNQMLLSRIYRHNWWETRPFTDTYFQLLTDNIVKKGTTFFLDSDRFYTHEGYDYFHSLVTENYGITLPELCKTLHHNYMDAQIEIFNRIQAESNQAENPLLKRPGY